MIGYRRSWDWWRGGGGYGIEGWLAGSSSGPERLGATMRVAKALQDLGGSASPEEIDAKLRSEHGLSAKQAMRARQHGMIGYFVAMSLTEAGRARLELWEASSTAQAELEL